MKWRSEGSARPVPRELLELVIGYVLQETLGPLRRIGRALAFGLAGALLLGFGLFLLMTGVLRALQEETGSVFAGSWNFAPYLLVGLLSVATMAAVVLTGTKLVSGSRHRAEEEGR